MAAGLLDLRYDSKFQFLGKGVVIHAAEVVHGTPDVGKCAEIARFLQNSSYSFMSL